MSSCIRKTTWTNSLMRFEALQSPQRMLSRDLTWWPVPQQLVAADQQPVAKSETRNPKFDLATDGTRKKHGRRFSRSLFPCFFRVSSVAKGKGTDRHPSPLGQWDSGCMPSSQALI